jgi:class 3 adenylate cyclase
VLTDIASFSDRRRNDDDRLFIREVLFTCVRRAAVDSGIPWERCHWEDRGDGLLLIVPAGIATTTVLESLPARVAFALHRHNRRSNAVGRIQLRLALHVGPVVSDRVGVSGDAIIHAARLLDASVFKRLIAGNQACLGLIVSDFVYHAMIRNGTAAVVPENYRRVQARVKQSQVTGWVAFHNPDPAPPQE